MQNKTGRLSYGSGWVAQKYLLSNNLMVTTVLNVITLFHMSLKLFRRMH
ncbi:hypothetical protein HanXRQr2_Chr15g0718931 [Helianthus annuus]|uniref:Uncharacterized protein n=1 Tax=Helianthus annuus TaxID=4232 RepID=A0A9K3H497_HELAN|nr:hypothetical protein HanXRQr2_Chr15g0718931 [Helianthus annuus]KAJ0833384.1 hypothetical protein HanPSC8_Chr15g0689761 [Helianthus annuus]